MTDVIPRFVLTDVLTSAVVNETFVNVWNYTVPHIAIIIIIIIIIIIADCGVSFVTQISQQRLLLHVCKNTECSH